jgi:hypothetical protein
MAKLSQSARNKLPKNAFAIKKAAGKAKGRYPIEDPAHARNALARVAQHGTPAEKAQVRSAVASKYPNIGHRNRRGKG